MRDSRLPLRSKRDPGNVTGRRLVVGSGDVMRHGLATTNLREKSEGLRFYRSELLKLMLSQWVNCRIFGVCVSVQRFIPLTSKHALLIFYLQCRTPYRYYVAAYIRRFESVVHRRNRQYIYSFCC